MEIVGSFPAQVERGFQFNLNWKMKVKGHLELEATACSETIKALLTNMIYSTPARLEQRLSLPASIQNQMNPILFVEFLAPGYRSQSKIRFNRRNWDFREIKGLSKIRAATYSQ